MLAGPLGYERRSSHHALPRRVIGVEHHALVYACARLSDRANRQDKFYHFLSPFICRALKPAHGSPEQALRLPIGGPPEASGLWRLRTKAVSTLKGPAKLKALRRSYADDGKTLERQFCSKLSVLVLIEREQKFIGR